MSRVEQKAVRARLVPAALGLGIALALTGCSAGMHSQTAVQVAAVNGASGKVGAIELRDVQFAFPAQRKYPARSNPAMILTLVNSGANDDKLVSIKSAGASGQAEIKGETKIPSGFALRAEANEAEHGAASGSATPSSSAVAPSSSAVTPSSGTGASTTGSATPTSGATPASGAQTGNLKTGSVVITLVGLKNELWPGQTVPVTFTFEKAGEVTLQVPIAADEEHRTNEPTSAKPGGGAGGGH